MNEKVVFFNIGWMEFYQGISAKCADVIVGGGKYVKKNGVGNEIFNFQEFEGKYYGYVQPKINKKAQIQSSIKIEKLGASANDDMVEHLTIIWTARNPYGGGSYIIGWYLDATIYRYEEKLPETSNRFYKHQFRGYYYACCDSKNASILSVDDRVFKIERQKKDCMGQSNVWYAQNNPQLIKEVIEYIRTKKIPINNGKGIPRQNDTKKRLAIEKKAIDIVINHYQSKGYTIYSVEKDNVGWDLNAYKDNIRLRIEVKGLSGKDYNIQLTPNEYKALEKYKNTYRLCIIVNCLTTEYSLKTFMYSQERANWVDNDGNILNFETITAARAYL